MRSIVRTTGVTAVHTGSRSGTTTRAGSGWLDCRDIRGSGVHLSAGRRLGC
jgi:hypothetical protein